MASEIYTIPRRAAWFGLMPALRNPSHAIVEWMPTSSDGRSWALVIIGVLVVVGVMIRWAI